MKKPSFNEELNTKNEKTNVVAKSKCWSTKHLSLECRIFYLDNGTFLYTGITIVVALIVFVLYMLLVK